MTSKTYIVGTSEELKTAANLASGGDVIKLKSGTYSDAALLNLSYDSTVTITSLDPANPAVFLNKLALVNVHNVHIDGLVFERVDIPDVGVNYGFNALVYMQSSSNVTLSNSKLTGIIPDQTVGDVDAIGLSAVPAGYAAGFGIYLSDTKDVTVEHNEISTLFQAIGLRDTENTTIANNHIHDLRSDGITGFDQINTVIENNLFENLHPYQRDPDNFNGATDDHADFIQYWTIGAEFGVDGLFVRDNIFIQEEGASQTIFGHIPLGEVEGVELTNFEVSGNLIYNSQGHGITISGVNNAKVFNNTLIPNHAVIDDHRDIPSINLSYNGAYPWQEGFDFNSFDVQSTRNVDVYNNVVAQSHDEGVRVKAYDSRVGGLAEIMAALNFKTWDNSWIDSKEMTAEQYTSLAKLRIETGPDGKTITIDPNAEIIHGGAGSVYYYDADALASFLSNLNTSQVITSATADLATDLTPILPAAPQITQPEAASEEAEQVTTPAQEEVQERAPEVVAQQETPTGPAAPARLEESPPAGPEGQEPTAFEVTNAPVKALATREVEPAPEISLASAVPSPVFVPTTTPTLLAPDEVLSGDALDAFDGPLSQLMGLRPGGSIEPVRSFTSTDEAPVAAAGAISPESEDMMVVVLEGSAQDYDIYLTDNGALSITDIATGTVDHAETIDAIFFRENKALYNIDAETGVTSFVGREDYLKVYHKLLDVNNAIQDGAASLEAHIEGEAGDDLLLAPAGVDFISGTAGRDIVITASDDAVVLGGPNVDTLVLKGKAEDYIHEVAQDTGMHKMFSIMTGNVTEFQSVEQIYFEDADQLHFVGHDSVLPHMDRGSYGSEYNRIETALQAHDGLTEIDSLI